MQQITVDINPGNNKKTPVFNASQYDVGREFRANLVENLVPYTLDGTELLTVSVRKGDNTLFTADIANTFGGKSYVDFVSTEQMCACAGFSFGELSITKNNTRIGTINFTLMVEPSPEEGGVSHSEINNLARQVEELVDDEMGDYLLKTEAEETYATITALETLSGVVDTKASASDLETLAGVVDTKASKTYVDSVADTKADKATTYTKTEVDTALGNKANSSDVYTKTQADDKFATKTSLATVATSGDYNDLNNKPSVAVIDDTQASASKVWSSGKTKELIDDVQDKLDSIEIECFNKVTHGGQTRQDIELTFTNGYYPEAKSGEINLLNNVVDVKYAVCDVVAGETVHIHAQNNWQVRAYLFANSSNNALSWYPSNSIAPDIFDDDVVVPENATKLYVMGKVATDVYVYRYVDLPITIGYEVDVDRLVTVLKHGNGYINASYSSDNLTISNDNVSIVAGLNSSSNHSFSFYSIYGKTANDDVCPVRMNNNYVGGNHGHPFVINVESTSAHGKTEADIGSVYVRSDDNTLEYVILAIVDTTHLKLIRKDGSLGYINPSLSFNFIHSSGGTHTDDITVSAFATMQQLYPSINNKSISVYADKDTFVAGSKKCHKITIAEVYNIMKPKAIADYLIANVGDNTNSSYYDDAISGLCRRTTVYEIYSDLSIVTSDYLLTLDTYTLTYLGIVQSQYLGTKFYVPYTTYSGVQSFSSNITLDNSVWANVNKAPHKYYQVSNDNDKIRGHLLLYPYFAIGKDRKDILGSDGNAGILEGATHKFYPRFYSDNESQSVDTMIGGYAIRVPFEFSQNGTFAFEYEIGGKKYVEVECLTEGLYEVNVGADNNVIVEVINSQNATLNSMCIVNGKILVKSLGNGSLTLEVN